jgi:gliding motility-associated-like protein
MLIGSSAFATHIVGGDFYYEYVGVNRYRITLKLYIDCENGNPQAIASDQTAIIGIFDSKNRFVRSFSMVRTAPKRLDKVLYSCVVPEKDVCVDGYSYTSIVTIDPGADGVILAFQRCCRNNTITNIIAPESTGATYWLKIAGRNSAPINSSPVFKSLPPNYLCTGAPLQFDHSATDKDGDSLAYELYQPFKGATRNNPRPLTPSSPAFQPVIWGPGYSTNNQMKGDPILKIAATSGELTVTPNVVGQFVIGVKVKEYRKGVLIGETLRDYQFNVRKCKFDIIANFTTPQSGEPLPIYYCNDSVYFYNKSYKAESYYWDFGDPTTDQDTSTEKDPSWIYPGDGDYVATLIATNKLCVDSIKIKVRIRENVKVDLGPDRIVCDDFTTYLFVNDLEATKIEWNTGERGSTIKAKDTGLYIAKVFYGQCTGRDSVRVISKAVIFAMDEDTIFCDTVQHILDANIEGPNIKYHWSTGRYDTFKTQEVFGEGYYWVRVNNRFCDKIDTMRLIKHTKPKIGPFRFICNEFELEIDAGDIEFAEYLWSDGSTNRFNTLKDGGLHWVEVRQGECLSRDSIFIENPVIDLLLGLDMNWCDSVDQLLKAPPDMASYLWQDMSTNWTFRATEPGTYYVTVTDTNGCKKADTVTYSRTYSPEVSLGEDVSICARMTADIGTSESHFRYEWSNGSTDPIITVSDEGDYILTVYDENGCFAKDTIHLKIDINALPNILYIANSFTPNGDKLNDLFPFAEVINQPEYRVRVFNRWGEKMFDSQEGIQSWDAKFNGDLVNEDAYIYQVEYRGCDGINRTQHGTITVLR